MTTKTSNPTKRAAKHLTEAQLRRRLDEASERDGRDQDRLLRQLESCAGCRRGFGGRVLALHRAGYLRGAFTAEEVDRAQSRADAPREVARIETWLADQPTGRKTMIPPDLGTWGAAEALMLQSEREAAIDPERAGETAALAALVARRSVGVGREGAPSADGLGLFALAFAHVANLLRVKGDLQGAEETFREARSFYGHYSRNLDPAAPPAADRFGFGARLLDLEASLAIDRREFDRARALLNRAERLARDSAGAYAQPRAEEWGNPLGRIMAKRSRLLAEEGDPLAALAEIRKAQRIVSVEEHPRLRLCLDQAAAVCLLDVGAVKEADRALPMLADLVARHGQPLHGVKVDWLRAQIARARGRTDEARELLETTWRRFARAGAVFDAALAVLELADLEAEEGRTAIVTELVTGLVPFFSSQDIHREALAALSLLAVSVARGCWTRELVAAVLDYLKRARHSPALAFTPPSGAPRS